MINPEDIIERNNFKKQVSRWRLLAFIAVTILVISLLSGAPSLKNIQNINNISSPYIARIAIDNVIYRDMEREEILEDLKNNDKVKAIILNVNSPGGSAVGGETLYRILKDINSKKPIITVMGSMATSAGYMITLGTERIFAHHGTITGSIGVIMQIPNFKKAADNLGISFEHIKSSPLKGSPSPFEEKNKEAFKVIKSMMGDFYKYFKQIVKTERKLSKLDFNRTTDGRIFSAHKALEHNLIDAIGTEQDAKLWLTEKHPETKDLEVVDVKLYKPEPPFKKFLGSFLEKIGINNLLPENFTYTGLLL